MGKLFVIDGTDGSGKQTQLEKLKERFEKDGIDYKLVSFPNYDSPSSSLVKMYLAGEFGENAKDVSPYIASTFFAADRYTTANMVHQAGKIANEKEREKFLEWLWDFEFDLYGLPVPTEVFFLKMPPEKALELIANRENKFTHDTKKDIHERDKNHIIDSYNAAIDVAKKYNWYTVKCVRNDEIRSIEDIHEEIYEEIIRILGENE